MIEIDGGSNRSALRAVLQSIARFVARAAFGWIHQPRGHVGERLSFANGTNAVIFRETVVGSCVSLRTRR
jgi:hypothetical protein